MAKDYRYERGLVGKWNGVNVIIVDKDKDILPGGDIYVASHNGMKMVHNGIVIGTLNPNGNVNQYEKNQQVEYFRKPKPIVKQEPVKVPAAQEGYEEILLETTIPAGYFDAFSFNVDNFFATLGKEQ